MTVCDPHNSALAALPGWTPEPGPGDPVPSRFSPTSFETYLRCPRRYWFAYVRRVRVRQQPTAALVLGQAVHAALAGLYRLPLGERGPTAAHRLLREAWASQPRKDVFLSRDEEAAWGRRALRLLDDYCGGWDLRIRPLALEEHIETVLRPMEVHIFGKADRIDAARAAAGIEVVDYKTGTPSVEEDDLGRHVPARVYALAAFRTFRQPVHRVRYIWLAERWEVTWQPETEDLAAAERDLSALAKQIQDDRTWEPRPGARCKWCPFASVCDARDAAGLDESAPPIERDRSAGPPPGGR